MANTRYKDVLLKAGKHTGKIAKAELTTSQYCQNNKNPNGDCLSVWVDVYNTYNERKRLFDNIPINNLLKLNELTDSLGLAPCSSVSELVERYNLEGQTVGVIVDVYTSKAGKKSNIVRSYDSLKEETFETSKDEYDDIPF